MAAAWRALTLSVVHGAPSLFDLLLLLLPPLLFPCFAAPIRLLHSRLPCPSDRCTAPCSL